MISQLKTDFLVWSVQVKRYMQSEFVDLQPQEYCIGAVFVIAIGFVLLSGRQ